MHIELWPIDRPKPYPKNAREWNAAAVTKVASSVREYGFRQPIVADAWARQALGGLSAHHRLAGSEAGRL